MKRAYFVTGIDTDAGKSIVTGVLARALSARGERVITQKFIQTGCDGLSEDIETHRRIMGIVFTYPASPHLAAAIDGRDIDLTLIGRSTEKLLQKYDTVLIEGAGGLYVPLLEAYQTIDYVAEHGLPVVLVTSPRLGSINHTLLSLEACRNRNIEVAAVAYNLYPPAPEPIVRDLKAYLADRFPAARWLEVNDRYELIGPDRP